MIITQAAQLTLADIEHCDFSVDITSELIHPYGDIRKTRPVVPSRKTYGFDEEDFGELGQHQALFVANENTRTCGYILVSSDWNRYALINDFAVDRTFRHGGTGTRLMDRALAWARSQGLGGLRLETQHNNIAACRFYQKYGFVLGGFDQYLYRALDPVRHEVALFWYYPLPATPGDTADDWFQDKKRQPKLP